MTHGEMIQKEIYSYFQVKTLSADVEEAYANLACHALTVVMGFDGSGQYAVVNLTFNQLRNTVEIHHDGQAVEFDFSELTFQKVW